MRSTMLRLISTGLACALLAACGGGDEDGGSAQVVNHDDELREWVDEIEKLAEDKNRRGLLGRISENYADGRGNEEAWPRGTGPNGADPRNMPAVGLGPPRDDGEGQDEVSATSVGAGPRVSLDYAHPVRVEPTRLAVPRTSAVR